MRTFSFLVLLLGLASHARAEAPSVAAKPAATITYATPTYRPLKAAALHVQNAWLRRGFEKRVAKDRVLTDKALLALSEAGIEVKHQPKLGLSDRMSKQLIEPVKEELHQLSAAPASAKRAARIKALEKQLLEYSDMPTTSERTTAFAMLGEDTIYTRLGRRGTVPQVANTLGHENVHIEDMPETNRLWDASVADESQKPAYFAFLEDGENRAYGQGSRLGGRLGEGPFRIAQPITDPNVKDRARVLTSICDNYVRGVREAVDEQKLFDALPAALRAEREKLAASYLAGYRDALPKLLDVRKANSRLPAYTPLEIAVDKVKDKLHEAAQTAFRISQTMNRPKDEAQAFEAGKLDVSRDLHPMSRLRTFAKE